jgi:hypothetical protein
MANQASNFVTAFEVNTKRSTLRGQHRTTLRGQLFIDSAPNKTNIILNFKITNYEKNIFRTNRLSNSRRHSRL